MTVTTGSISTRDDARIHLAIDGGIGDNHTRNVSYRTNPAGLTATHPLLCRRCFTPARIAAAQASLIDATGVEAEAMRGFLADLVGAAKTPEELAAEEPMVADLIASIQYAKVIYPETRDPQVRRDLWDAARDSHDAPLLVA